MFTKLAPAVSVHLNPLPRNAGYTGSPVAKMFKVVATIQLRAASSKLSVDLVHNAEPKKLHYQQSHLNFEASNVRRLDNTVDAIGGLLGVDDHTEAMNPLPVQRQWGCARGPDGVRLRPSSLACGSGSRSRSRVFTH